MAEFFLKSCANGKSGNFFLFPFITGLKEKWLARTLKTSIRLKISSAIDVC